MNNITKWLFLAVILARSLVFAGQGESIPLANMPLPPSISLTSLGQAAKIGDLDKVKELLTAGANINAGDMPPLVVATAYGHTSIVRELLKAKADMNARGQIGMNALKVAIIQHHIGIVRELLGAGANVHGKSPEGLTPLMEAAAWGRPTEVVEFLKAGADINAKNDDNWTSLMLANRSEHQDVIIAIRGWSIKNQVKITDPRDVKILDIGVPGSYDRAFKVHAEKVGESEVVGPDDEPVGPGER